jgi:hypothetical protein
MALQQVIDPKHNRVDLHNYTRRYPSPPDRHMVLEAKDAVSRRELLEALKSKRPHLRAHPHLSAVGKANKTLVYYQTNKSQTSITDKGDILIVAWRQHPQVNVVLDILQPTEYVLNKLHTFFGARPKNVQRPPPNRMPP